jgi:hypothetical protein
MYLTTSNKTRTIDVQTEVCQAQHGGEGSMVPTSYQNVAGVRYINFPSMPLVLAGLRELIRRRRRRPPPPAAAAGRPTILFQFSLTKRPGLLAGGLASWPATNLLPYLA